MRDTVIAYGPESDTAERPASGSTARLKQVGASVSTTVSNAAQWARGHTKDLLGAGLLAGTAGIVGFGLHQHANDTEFRAARGAFHAKIHAPALRISSHDFEGILRKHPARIVIQNGVVLSVQPSLVTGGHHEFSHGVTNALHAAFFGDATLGILHASENATITVHENGVTVADAHGVRDIDAADLRIRRD